MKKATEYTGIKVEDPYYVMVRIPDGHYFLHAQCQNFDEAFAQHQAAVKLYLVQEKDVEIVKVLEWTEVEA